MSQIKEPRQVTVTLPEDDCAVLEVIAHREQRSFAALVRIAVASFIATYGKKAGKGKA